MKKPETCRRNQSIKSTRKKNSLSVQNKTNLASAKDCKYNQKWTGCKNNQCKKKI